MAPEIQTDLAWLDEHLGRWREALGHDYAGYRNHCARVWNFRSGLGALEGDQREKTQIALVHHDLGLFSEQTVDYLAPSVTHAKAYLAGVGKEDWGEEIGEAIELHHKLTPYRGPNPLVEGFRRADLVDFSLGVIRFGLPRGFISEVRSAFPNEGFHRRILRSGAGWLVRNPTNPAPIFRL